MASGRNRDDPATPLATKLGIRAGARVHVAGAPDRFAIDGLPPDVDLRATARGPLDVVLVFVTRRADLAGRFPRLVRALEPDGRLWVAWPKKASRVRTDLTFEAVQRLGLDAGLVDNKSAAIDDVFQGLQFVYRLRDRPR